MSGWANFHRPKSHTLRNKAKYRFQSCSRAFGYLRKHIIPNEIAYIIIWNSNVTACKVRLVWLRGTTSISRLPVSLITISMIVQASLEPKDLQRWKVSSSNQLDGGRKKKKRIDPHELFPAEKKRIDLMESDGDVYRSHRWLGATREQPRHNYCWFLSTGDLIEFTSERVLKGKPTSQDISNAPRCEEGSPAWTEVRTVFLLLLMFPFQNNSFFWMTFFGLSGKTFF